MIWFIVTNNRINLLQLGSGSASTQDCDRTRGRWGSEKLGSSRQVQCFAEIVSLVEFWIVLVNPNERRHAAVRAQSNHPNRAAFQHVLGTNRHEGCRLLKRAAAVDHHFGAG